MDRASSFVLASLFVCASACASGIEAHPEEETGGGAAGEPAAGNGGASAGSGTSGAGAGSGTAGTATAGSGTSGSSTAGSGTSGSGTAGSGTAGSGTSGSGTAGSGTAGSGTAGSGTSGSATAGSGTSGSGTAGSGTSGSGTAGSGTSGSGTAGSGTSGSGTAGSGTAGSGTAGTGTAGTGTAGSGAAGGTAGSGTAGTTTAGSGGSTSDPCNPTVSYDFESGVQGFTHAPTSGLAVDDPWAHGAAAGGGFACHGGTKCFATGLTNAGYDDCQTAELKSPTIDLSACAGSSKTVRLSFFHIYKWEVMSSGKWWDGGLLQISSDDGASWQDATTSMAYQGLLDGSFASCSPPPDVKGHQGWSGVIAGGTWAQVTVDLAAPYRVSKFRFRFLMGADAATTGRGWAIDDVAITAL